MVRHTTASPLCPSYSYLTRLEYKRLEWRINKEPRACGDTKECSSSVEKKVSYGEGYMPIRRIKGILAKLENRNPTRSYADRASSVITSYGELTTARLCQRFHDIASVLPALSSIRDRGSS